MVVNSKVNLALVGICGYGASYLNALLDRPAKAADGFRLVGVVDPAAAQSPRLGDVRARGIPVHADISGLFATTTVDLTLMSTPIHLHAPHTCAALAHGSNVLCEKPLAATVDDALRVIAAEQRHGLFAAIGYQWSFSQAVQDLKRDVMSGALGAPRRLRTLVMFPRGEGYYHRNKWAGRVTTEWGERVYDSPLNNAAAHYLHNMLYVLGATRESTALPAWLEAELYRANDIESFDTAALRCRTPDGVEVLLYTTHCVPERVGPVCRFEFERAVVEYDHAGGNGGREAGAGGHFVARFHDGRVRDYGRPEFDRNEKIWQCVDAVRTGAPVACTARAALPHTLCVAAAQTSSPTVNFPDALRRHDTTPGEGTMTWVEGLGEALADCFGRGVLPSECGCSWARPGRRVAVTPVVPQSKEAVSPFAASV